MKRKLFILFFAVIASLGTTNAAITVGLAAQNPCWSTVYLWAWQNDGNTITNLFDEWPGVEVSLDSTGLYSYTFDESVKSVNIIWTDGKGNQTKDITGVNMSTIYWLYTTVGNAIETYVFDYEAGFQVIYEASIGDFRYELNYMTQTAKVISVTNKNMTSMTIPATVEDSIFYDEDSLFNVVYNVTTIGEYAFWNCEKLASIVIPSYIMDISPAAFCSELLTSIAVDEGNPVYDSRNSCNAIIKKANALNSNDILVTGCINTVIPNDVEVIGSGAFIGCRFKSIQIPENIIAIGNSAFRYCIDATTLTISSNVVEIGESAFSECNSLRTIYNNAPTPQVINSNVFDGVDKLRCHLYVPDDVLPLYLEANGWKELLLKYSACYLELVGDAIPAQEGVHIDYSTWNWGNVYSMGTPVKEGNNYIWHIGNIRITTSGEGFKIRTYNAKDSGGVPYFDYGKNGKFGENLTVEEDANYDITFTINSVTEDMTYLCEKHIATAVESVSKTLNPTKQIKDGQILILRGEKTYTIQGQEVR